MFRLYKSALLFLGGLLMLHVSYGQRIVDTQPQLKKAILEEFGGIYCVYCPHAHQIVRDLEAAIGDNLVAINYQVGSYAEPIEGNHDLRSDYGDAIADRTALSGYPAGTINRQVFPGLEQDVEGSTAVSRSDWAEAVSSVITQSAPVNIAAEATLDIVTNNLELYIEYYYTSTVDHEDNRLHIALMQNNLFAPQHGGGSGDFYVHQHVVRDYLTGARGHQIVGTDAQTFGSLTYNISLPNNYRDIWLDPANVELAIFIGEGDGQILNGISIQPTLISPNPADANLLALKGPDDLCSTDYIPTILLRNDGLETLQRLDITYGVVDGDSNSYQWDGSLSTFETIELVLPSISVAPEDLDNELYVKLQAPNGSDDPTLYNNERMRNFTLAPRIGGREFDLAIRTDEYGFETYWEIVNEAGEIQASGGNEVVGQTNGGAQIATPNDVGAYANNELYIEPVYLAEDGCYQLRVLDDFADGLCCFYGNGFFRFGRPGQSPTLLGGRFGALTEMFFVVDQGSIVNVAEALNTVQFTLAPSLVHQGQNIRLLTNDDNARYNWQLIATDGRVLQQGQESQLPLTHTLTSGMYWLRIQSNEHTQQLSFVVQ